jgi:hypothetical protein
MFVNRLTAKMYTAAVRAVEHDPSGDRCCSNGCVCSFLSGIGKGASAAMAVRAIISVKND